MRRALVVGIDDYQDDALSGCVNDANAIAAVLETHATGTPNFDILLRTSPPIGVTRRTLREDVRGLFETECDIALFYFSGHGFVRGGDGCVVTQDAQTHDEGISMAEILRLANGSPVKNKVIVLDCCHAGHMGTPDARAGAMAQLAEGLTVLAASRGSEAAMEGGGGGVFTGLVLEALRGGAADLRGHVTPGSVYAYVDRALGAWDQRPVFKTNVTTFTSLREVQPPVPLDTLRNLPVYFSAPNEEHSLDPNYEDTVEGCDPEKVRIFKDLQAMEGVGLVVPVGEHHMYYAAIKSKSCRLTAVGAQYWRLARESRL